MKILVAGCSFAEHLSPIIQQKIPQARITNRATWGVGNKFISDSVVLSTLDNTYDVVYVSWTGFSRYDVCIDPSNKSFFDGYPIQKNLFNRQYVCTGGTGGWDYHEHPAANMLFTGFHKLVNDEQLHYNSLLEIIKIQRYLEQLGTPFYFTSFINQFTSSTDNMVEHTCEYGTTRYPQNNHLVDKIDFSRWILDNNNGIHEAVKQLGMIGADKFHPNPEGYRYWMDLFVTRLKNDKIL